MIKIGDKSSAKRKWSKQDVVLFAQLSGDVNPVHINEEYAKETIFGKCIVHGFLVGSLISAVIANQLPGEGAIYLNQEMKFRKPVFYDEEITCEVEVLEIILEKSNFKLKTTCFKENGEVVIEGTALIKHIIL